MARLHELFRYCQANGASDLHLVAQLEPRVRRRGHLEAIPGWAVLADAELRALLREVVSGEQWDEFERDGDLDFAYGLEGVARFRGNYLVQEQGASAVFRAIPQEIITLEQLNLPPAIERLAHLPRGLVLVTGPTGSGKSTTLAAIIDRINRTYRKHVVTIEDPVEFVHQNRECVFSQREVGTDCDDFSGALRGALREDADVILVGEMRDLETIALA
ncbi:MAG TPA: ATPase, T2SS/T4P/T4SS family, partial [Thermoanaerobaculia bacterium]|nr:ATPase, T2SS/T4P/T4SS family [Thermoanaerobaculia bacterium]